MKNQKYKIMAIGGSALLLLCLILGFVFTYKGKPKDAKELLTYASELMDKTKYVEGEIKSEIVGVQEEQNISLYIDNQYAYDVVSDVCKAELDYNTKIGEATVDEYIHIWNVGTQEKKDKKEVTVHYAYTQTQEEDTWYREEVSKTNDEIYRLNVFEIIMKDKDAKLKLKDKTEKVDDVECYKIEATISATTADMITSEVDVLSAISEGDESIYKVSLYFNKRWEPVKTHMDFAEQVVVEGEKEGLAIVIDKAYFEQTYKSFKLKNKLSLPSKVEKDALKMTSSGGETESDSSNENKFEYKYPLSIVEENTSTIILNEVKNLVINKELTTGDYAQFYLDNVSEYNYIEAYSYNYKWAETNEQALKLLLDSVSNMEEFLKSEESYELVFKSETTKTSVEDYDVHVVNMSYKHDDSLFHQTDAFIQIQEKEFLRVTIVVVTGVEEQNPVDTDAFIKKFVKAMEVNSEDSVN